MFHVSLYLKMKIKIEKKNKMTKTFDIYLRIR